MEVLKSIPIVTNTEYQDIDNNAFLRIEEAVSEGNDIYQSVDIYYRDTEERHYLGMIYYEDPSHLNMIERYIFSKELYIVIRQNLATGEIVDYKNAFDIKARRYVNDSEKVKRIYNQIKVAKEKNNKKKSDSKISKMFNYFFPFNN